MITIYVLRSLENSKRDVGITDNLLRRIKERRPVSTVGKLLDGFMVLRVEELADSVEARKREKFLKPGQGLAWLDQKYPC